jgi:hypothetical protein
VVDPKHSHSIRTSKDATLQPAFCCTYLHTPPQTTHEYGHWRSCSNDLQFFFQQWWLPRSARLWLCFPRKRLSHQAFEHASPGCHHRRVPNVRFNFHSTYQSLSPLGWTPHCSQVCDHSFPPTAKWNGRFTVSWLSQPRFRSSATDCHGNWIPPAGLHYSEHELSPQFPPLASFAPQLSPEPSPKLSQLSQLSQQPHDVYHARAGTCTPSARNGWW